MLKMLLSCLIIVSVLMSLVVPITIAAVPTSQRSPPICGNPCVISISNDSFDGGKEVIILSGTLVSWKNDDGTPHLISGIGNWTFNSGLIVPGKSSGQVQFVSVGAYYYSCEVSLALGKILVIN